MVQHYAESVQRTLLSHLRLSPSTLQVMPKRLSMKEFPQKVFS